MKINLGRLRKDIEELAQIGLDSQGGISRPSFSRADLEARAWFKDKLNQAGLIVRQDGAGNIFGRLAGEQEGPVILVGSHLDTVIHGGRFDGSCGVLSGLECLRVIKEQGRRLRKPIEVVSFTDEEGNLVGDFLGSRAFVGCLREEELKHGQTQFGRPLSEILEGTEFSLDSILQANQQAPKVEAYLELHIEQGEVLELEEVPLGIVTKIAGKRLYLASFGGRPGHAGTVPLELRQDALLGLADFALRGTRLVASEYDDARITIGRVQLHPGSFSIVPGRADFTLDLRSLENNQLRAMEKSLLSLAEEVASSRGLTFHSRLIDSTDPTPLSSRLISLLEEEAGRLGYSWVRLTSGAGHDAQILAAVAETAMIFIPSPEGISHSPEETIRWQDLEKGANLLLAALVKLAAE
ncbi:MAG: Zn-dependent hydrolase [Candidatus Aminicenantales bacterium]